MQLRDRVAALETEVVPAGIVDAFTGLATLVPAGWLLCDGRTLSGVNYPELYAALSTRHGQGDGGPRSFSIPDYRGWFLRGANIRQADGTWVGKDPQRETREASGTGGTTGASHDVVGSKQSGSIEAHLHPITDVYHNHILTDPGHVHDVHVGWQNLQCGHLASERSNREIDDHTQHVRPRTYPSLTGITMAPALSGITATQAAGSPETRPRNKAVHYIIKAGRYVVPAVADAV